MIRRKILTTLLLVAVVLSAGYAGLAIAADSGDPGSRLDPLVTKSFVEQYVEKYVKEALNTAPSSDFQWRIKTVAAGQVFTGGAGTEFIVRSGNAVIVDPVRSGIPDLTAGTNGGNGHPAAHDHLFLVPRADGRGIRAQSSVIIMYRGGGTQ
jgi:hypothetical protein